MGRRNGVHVFRFPVFCFLSVLVPVSSLLSFMAGNRFGQGRDFEVYGILDTGGMVLGAMRDGLFLFLTLGFSMACVMFIPPRRGRNETTFVYYSIS